MAKWRDLTAEQQRALAKIGKEASTADGIGSYISTFIACLSG